MEFLLFSDFHAHNFRYGSCRIPLEGRPGLYNSRLVDSVKVLRQLGEYADQHGITNLLFGGDLFHRRQRVSTDVFNLIYTEITRLASDKKIIMLPGNHDYADRVGNVHSLEPFADIPNVEVAETGAYDLGGVRLYTLPYTDDREKAVVQLKALGADAAAHAGPTLLLAHLGIQGARVGSDYVLVADHDVSVPDIPYRSFSGCFFGHYHQHQRVFTNGWFIGATHQHNWGDVGTQRGFLHVEVPEKGSAKILHHVESSAPKFIKTTIEALATVDPNNFVRLYTQKTPSDVAQLAASFLSLEVIVGGEEEALASSIPSTIMNSSELINSWVDLKNTTLDKAALITLGEKLLAQAEGADL